MTKEQAKFKDECSNYCRQWMASREVDDLEELFDQFFSQNVCIPKGENRHREADVFHAWAEGAECEYKNTLGRVDGWNKLCFPLAEYRIKPSEPIYEWQYLITTMFGANENKLSKFMTDDEFIKAPRSRSEGWIKIEETKQVRV